MSNICHFNNFISFSYTPILSVRISCLQAANDRRQERRETIPVLSSRQRSVIRHIVQNNHRVRLRCLFPEFSPATLYRILGNYIHM